MKATRYDNSPFVHKKVKKTIDKKTGYFGNIKSVAV
jgi:hypothetical protein